MYNQLLNPFTVESTLEPTIIMYNQKIIMASNSLLLFHSWSHAFPITQDVTGGAAAAWNSAMPTKEIRTFDPWIQETGRHVPPWNQ